MMSDDMVKELREFSVQGQDDYPDWYPEICTQAADEIERLRALNAELVAALIMVRKIISDAALTGFNCHDGEWAERLFASQALTHDTVRKAKESE
jgi:hypothetical protein